MKIKDIITDFVIMPQTADALGLIHKPGSGPNSRFDFKNKGNNRANETKEAPPGTYFTKTGNLVKGRLTKAAKERGARETDPKDKQRSKVPPVTQRNEARGTCWHGYQQKGYKKKGDKMVPNCVKEEEAAGVGIVTKQNATKDVPIGGEYMNVKKLSLGKGKPKPIREKTTRTSKKGAPGTLKAKIKGPVTIKKAMALKNRRGATPHDKAQANWYINMVRGRRKKK
jgi:hypothetical protein